MHDEKKSQSEKPAKSVRELLSAEIQTTPWHFLKPHSERDGVIVVAQSLDLLEVGCAIVENHAQTVEQWVNDHRLAKPTKEQLDSWDQEPAKQFNFLIAQPWVVIQACDH
jgi:hypothetical protein